MGFRNKITSILLVSIIIFGGCGTTHHFLPSRPLDNEDWMISLAWHYDLNRMGGSIFPDVNAYMGIGKNYNLGFGAQFPLFITHASLVKYFDIENNDNWAFFTHLNEIFGANNNPVLEIGGMRNWIDNSISQNLSFGVAFGQEQAWAVNRNAKRYSWIILPSLKYSITGSEAGLSLIHYNGQTKSAIMASLPGIIENNDTLYIFEPGELDSISLVQKVREMVIFYTAQGKSISAISKHNYADAFYDALDALQYWLPDKYTACQFRNFGTAVIDMAKLKKDLVEGNKIVITRYPEPLIDEIKHLNSLTNDLSIGLGVFSYPK